MQQQRVTANNINVYSYRQSHLHSFCIGLYVKAGVLYEKPEEAGITHFLEHVLFRNLGGMPQKELYEKLERMGAYFNASTYKEFVQFYIMATPGCFMQCAEIITKLLAPLSATVQDINVERKRIQSEIREENGPDSLEYTAAREIWKDTTLSNPIMGTITGIQKIKLEDLRLAKNETFTSSNLCFYVSGCFTPEDIDGLCKLAERYPVAQGEGSHQNITAVPEGFLKRGGAIRIKNSDDLPSLCFSFDVAYSKYSMAEMNLLNDILFRGNLSRFQTQLSENNGLIYSFDSTLDQYSNIGAMYVEYSVAKSKLYQAIALTVETFRSMKTRIDDADLSYHLPRYRDNYDIMLDEPERLNWDMAYDNFVLGRGFASIEEVKGQFIAVTPGRLMEIANEIFQVDNLVLVIKAPKNKCREDKVREIISAL